MIHLIIPGARFSFGQIVSTPGAIKALEEAGESAVPYLVRHGTGDWGDLCAEDIVENELALREGFRILSAYRTGKGVRFWIITEADRSVTTLLLPSEY